MDKFICNATHRCPQKGNCQHAKPHDGKGAGCNEMIGGAWSFCDATKILSHCVPVVDGVYEDTQVEWCTCGCGDKHTKAVITKHEI